MRIALLGNTQDQAERLRALLGAEHELLKIGSAASGRESKDVDVAVTIRLTAADAERLRFRLLQVSGAGLDSIALDAVPADCWICNVFEHEGPIAEYVMLAVLEHVVGLEAMARAFSNETWSETFRTRRHHGEVAGRTLGLVGFGHIGRAIAARARAFGMRVVAVTASGRATPEADWIGPVTQIGEVLGQADALVIACPLTPETRDLIGTAELGAMKRSALLINVARGEIVNEEALYHALESRRIAGAVLDAWYQYPTPSAPNVPPSRFRFDRLPNVRCTPHSAGWTEPLFARRYAVIAENIRRFGAGEPLLNVVRAGRAA